MKTTIECPNCHQAVTLNASMAKLGAILGAVVGATSRRGIGLRGALRGAAVGGGVAYVLSRVLAPTCPACKHKVETSPVEADA